MIPPALKNKLFINMVIHQIQRCPAKSQNVNVSGASHIHIKVNIQWMLYCLVHNIEKISYFGKSYSIQGV
jgi:hypothetical protein